MSKPVEVEAGADVKMEVTAGEAPAAPVEEVKPTTNGSGAVNSVANGSASTADAKPEVKDEVADAKAEVKSESTDKKPQDKRDEIRADTKDSDPEAEHNLSTPTIDGKSTEEVEDLMARVAKQSECKRGYHMP